MKKTAFYIALVALVVAGAELLCATALRLLQGNWTYAAENYNQKLFEPDTLLVGVPKKNISLAIQGIHYSHNSDGFRGKNFQAKTKKRIACIGGSTTYCIGVNDNETWPFYLDSLLQPEYEVMNFGIPGHSTVEHKKLLPEIISRYAPDIVLFQVGLNDMRCMHVNHLANDYSNFHQPSLYASFGFCLRDRLPRSALLYAAVTLFQKIKVIPACPFPDGNPGGVLSDTVDEKVAENFSNNVDTLLQQCFNADISAGLLPQLLSEDVVTDENYRWWIPYLTKKGIFSAQQKMNDILQSKGSAERRVIFLAANGNVEIRKEDFFDASHLNARGNLKLAEFLAVRLHESPLPPNP